MLTKQQKRLYDFLCAEISSNGYAPSFEEMREHLGLASKSGIHRLIEALEERGFIRRLRHRARAIEIIKEPPDPLQAFHDCREILEVVRAAKGLSKVPFYHKDTVTVTENSYRAVIKALGALHAK